MHGRLEIFVEEGLAQTMAGVGQQRVDRPVGYDVEKLIDAFASGEIDLQMVDRRAHAAEGLGGLHDLGPIGGDHQVETILNAELGQFLADAGGGAGDEGERTDLGHQAASFQSVFRTTLVTSSCWSLNIL